MKALSLIHIYGVFKMTGGALSGDSTNGQALYVAGEKNAKLSGGTIDGGGDDKTAITVGTGAVGKLLAEGCYYYKVTLASPNGKKVTDVSGDTLSGKYIVDNRTVAQYTTCLLYTSRGSECLRHGEELLLHRHGSMGSRF